MKTIEKLTRDGDVMWFEVITSRKELASFMRDVLWESLYCDSADRIYRDEDTATYYYDKDDNLFSIVEGEAVKRPNISRIKKLVQINSSTTVIYGDVEIVFNEHYGDWEADLN